MIEKNYLPRAAAIGIPYDVFQRVNPKILDIYEKAYVDKAKIDVENVNYEAWLRGYYEISAVACALDSKKNKYPEKPYSRKQEQESFTKEEKFLLWIDEYNRRFDKEHGNG